MSSTVPETNERAGDGDSGIPCMQIRTSLGFENSARVVIDGASTAASRKSLKLKWLEKPALVHFSDDDWYLAASITKSQDSGSPWRLRLTGVDGKVANLTKIEEGSADGDIDQIILGFVGGTFEKSDEEKKVRVTAVVFATDDTIVKFSYLDDGGNPVGESDERMMIDAFVDEYVKTTVEAADSGPSSDTTNVDFAPYPRLLQILKKVHAFGPDGNASDLPYDSAHEVLVAMNKPSFKSKHKAGDMSIFTLAAHLEEVYSAPAASPELTTLHSVSITGALNQASMKAKGATILSLVFGKTSNKEKGKPEATPAGGRTTASSKRKKPIEIDPDEQDDSDSGAFESSDEEEDDGKAREPHPKRKKTSNEQPPAAPSKQNKGSKRKRPMEQELSDDDSGDDGDGGDDATFHELHSGPDLASLLPSILPMDVARIIFAEPAVRDLVSCMPVPAAIPAGDNAKMYARYNFAYKRLVARVGEGWRTRPNKPARNKAMLEAWAEAILDMVATMSSGLGDHLPFTIHGRAVGGDRTSSAMGGRLPIDADPSASKPAEGLSAAKAAASISPAVSERLHAGKEAIMKAVEGAQRKSPAAGVADVIGEAPENLRDDLRRVARSNGLVDAPGETLPTRKAAPPPAHGLRRTLLREVEREASLITSSDSTGETIVDAEVISALAAAGAEGSITLDDCAKAARKALGKAAAQQGSHLAVAEAWSWLQPILTAVLKGTKAPATELASIQDISTRVNSPQHRLPPDQMADWIEKILRLYKCGLRDFRSHEAQMPEFRECIEQMAANFQYKSLHAALFKTEQTKYRTTHDASSSRSDKAASGRTSPGPKKDKAAPANPGASKSTKANNAAAAPNPTGWPERKMKISDAKFKELKEGAIKDYPDVCAFYILAKCGRAGKCTNTHSRPANFEDFLSKHKLNIDGSEKVGYQ